MKNFNVVSRTGTFQHYLGKPAHYVLVAVTRVIPETDTNDDSIVGEMAVSSEYSILSNVPLKKELRIGLSVCNPLDPYNEHKGVVYAYNVAMSENPTRYLGGSNIDLFSSDIVERELDNLSKYLENNPNTFIKGYDEMAKRHTKKLEKK